MLKINDKYKDIIFKTIVLFTGGVLIYFNFTSDNFFVMSLYQIISLILVVLVSYYLTQKKLDSRKKREVLNELVERITKSSIKMNREAIQSENAKLFVMEIRNIQNKISLINKVSSEYNINNEIEYINREIENINNMVSNHIGDIDTLLKIFVDIEKNINNIQNKCEEIQFKIYFY